MGDWGLGIGDWGLGPIPNPQSPIPNPQSPYIMFLNINKKYFLKIKIIYKFYFIYNIKLNLFIEKTFYI